MNKSLELETTVVARQDAMSADLSGETIVLGMSQGEYFGLDEIGSRVWTLIQSPTTVRQVCETLTKEYDVELDRCKEDIIELLQSFAACELIDVVPR
jgi:hypothetical protein